MKTFLIVIGLVVCLSWSCFGEDNSETLCTQEEVANGNRTVCFSDGSEYTGQFKDGVIHGQGSITFRDGSRYTGEFENGEIHGQGTMIFPDGSEYVGQFKHGMIHGQGTITFSDGSRYQGQFKDDKYHGEGVWSSPYGIKYSGQFKAGKFDGQGIYSLPDGSRYIGLFKDNHFHGSGSWDRGQMSDSSSGTDFSAQKRSVPNLDDRVPDVLNTLPAEENKPSVDITKVNKEITPGDSDQPNKEDDVNLPEASIYEESQISATKGGESKKLQAENTTANYLQNNHDNTASGLSFSVQVGAFLSRSNADKLASMLIEKGYTARMVPMSDYSNRPWYTVRLGSYSTFQEAKDEAMAFSVKEKIAATVRPMDAL